MTDRLIVATFRDTNAAYDAASAIKNLKDSGLTDFKLKAGVMVQKDDRGNVSLIEDRNRPLVGTAVGTAAGALIGLLGGATGRGGRGGYRGDDRTQRRCRDGGPRFRLRRQCNRR